MLLKDKTRLTGSRLSMWIRVCIHTREGWRGQEDEEEERRGREEEVRALVCKDMNKSKGFSFLAHSALAHVPG